MGCYWMSCQSVMRIHKCLNNIYGVNAVHKGTVLSLGFTKCRFWRGPIRLKWRHCPGRPTVAVTHLLLQHADGLIQNDQHITTQKCAHELSASKEYVNNIMDGSRYWKVWDHWVLVSLTNNHKTVWMGWVHICCPIMRLMAKALSHDHHLEWNMDPTVWTAD
jgi:hypothetical protein